VARVQRTLLGAYRRYGKGEDRLTELLALALESHPAFARALLDRCLQVDDRRPPVVAERFDARCQVWTDLSRIVDLELRAFDGDGRLTALVWSENKIWAAYQHEQLQSYASSLERSAGPHPRRLVTIVSETAQAPDAARALDIPVLTWSEVARIAVAAGRTDEHGARWRTHALSPGMPAGIRVLEEFIRYLEEEHAVNVDPLSFDHVRAFQLATAANGTLVDLVSLCAFRIADSYGCRSFVVGR
jgi:hypothetical protein